MPELFHTLTDTTFGGGSRVIHTEYDPSEDGYR